MAEEMIRVPGNAEKNTIAICPPGPGNYHNNAKYPREILWVIKSLNSLFDLAITD